MIRTALVLMIALWSSLGINAQDTRTLAPSYEKGQKAFIEFLFDEFDFSLVENPHKACFALLVFVVDLNGELSRFEIEKDSEGDRGPELVRVISQTSGEWSPAQIKGTPTVVAFELPVRFEASTSNAGLVDADFAKSAKQYLKKAGNWLLKKVVDIE
ncbi:hypothetical protein N8482_00805 [Chitinophagales bacterium]|nr:hypothetical protein [Chitinophagales bacterium]